MPVPRKVTSLTDIPLKEATIAAEGVVFTTWVPDPDVPSPERLAFDSAYRARYGTDAGIFAAEAYDAARLLAQAISERGNTGEAIRESLLNVADYPGASGRITFDENGDCMKAVFVKAVRDGAFVYTSF